MAMIDGMTDGRIARSEVRLDRTPAVPVILAPPAPAPAAVPERISLVWLAVLVATIFAFGATGSVGAHVQDAALATKAPPLATSSIR